MAAPKRTATLGSEASLVEDLRLARDAGGLDLAAGDRLAGAVRLRLGVDQPSAAQVKEVRAWLAGHVERGCASYAVLHVGDRTALAAAESVRQLLLRARDDNRPAAVVRAEAVKARSLFIAPDSLRKRELPVLALIAESAYADAGDDEGGELFVSVDSMLRVLAPFAELAALNVEDAAKKFSMRAALHDDAILVRAVQHAIWAVAKLGVLPVYGLDRLRVLGVSSFADQALEQVLEAITRAPFVTEPDDMYQLATASRLDEDAEPFYERLIGTPVMQPVVQRFVVWLAGHDGRTCHYFDNDVMVGYCGPHYYVSLCESLVFIQEDWASGAFQAEADQLVSTLGLAQRRQAASEDQPTTRS